MAVLDEGHYTVNGTTWYSELQEMLGWFNENEQKIRVE